MSQAEIPYELSLRIIYEKHAAIAEILKTTHTDCWMVFVRETASIPDPIMPLIVGNDIVGSSAFIFAYDHGVFRKIAIVAYFDANTEQKKGIWDEVIGYQKESIKECLPPVIAKINPKKIALDYSEDDVSADGLTYGMYQRICKILPDYIEKFVSAKSIIQKVRGLKSPTEIRLISESCKLTEKINSKIGSQLMPGMTEVEIQDLFFQEMDRLGVKEAWQRDSCPAVDAGPEKELGHTGPLAIQKTKEGHLLHNDFGIKLQGYCSDLQRMWYFGSKTEIPLEIQRAFNVVKNAIQKAAEGLKPGVQAFTIDKLARDHVLAEGYQEYMHSLGHQVGTKAHDGGVSLAPLWEKYGEESKGFIEENQIFTLELEVKTPNYGWISLEEMVVVTKDGCQFLSNPQLELICI